MKAKFWWLFPPPYYHHFRSYRILHVWNGDYGDVDHYWAIEVQNCQIVYVLRSFYQRGLQNLGRWMVTWMIRFCLWKLYWLLVLWLLPFLLLNLLDVLHFIALDFICQLSCITLISLYFTSLCCKQVCASKSSVPDITLDTTSYKGAFWLDWVLWLRS